MPLKNAPERDDHSSSEGKDPSSYSDNNDYDDEGDVGRGDEDGGAEEAAADDAQTMSPPWRPIQGNWLKPR